MRITKLGKSLLYLLLLLLTGPATAAPVRTLDGYLRDGRITEGLDAFASPKNNGERFSLAVLQALDGLQQFCAGSCQLGVNQDFLRSGLPFFRVMPTLAATGSASNYVATPEKVAALFHNLGEALRTANTTLAGIDAQEFKVEVNLSTARLDFNGDGLVAPDELLMTKLGPVLGFPLPTTNGPDLLIHFDSADAMWLKGYTHFLIGVIDILLAYDWHPVWNQCAGVFFQNPDPAPPLARFSQTGPDGTISRWVDLIAALHDMRLEVVDPDRLANARKEFMAVVGCSRVCWQRVLAETDNDHEWLPSPKQTGPGGAKVTQAQIDGWRHVLDELEAILNGKKLLPHWRLKNGVGINVPKLVAAPPRLDLILMIQGSALIPYLEEGTVSDLTTWRALMEPFGSGFTRFALWSQ